MEGPENLISSIALALDPLVVSVEKPFNTFNYLATDFDVSGRVNSRSATPENFLSDAVDYFWNPSQALNTSAYGNGLYLALDPAVSLQYGGSPTTQNFGLFQIRIPKGAKLLRLLEDGSTGHPEIDAKIAQWLTSAGCDATVEAAIRPIRADLSCRKLALNILRQTGIDAIVYTWKVSTISLCSGRSPSAIVLVNSKIFSGGHFDFLTEKRRDNSKKSWDAQAIRAYVNTQLKDDKELSYILAGDLDGLKKRWQNIWPTVDPVPDAEFAKWLSDNLLNCQYPDVSW